MQAAEAAAVAAGKTRAQTQKLAALTFACAPTAANTSGSSGVCCKGSSQAGSSSSPDGGGAEQTAPPKGLVQVAHAAAHGWAQLRQLRHLALNFDSDGACYHAAVQAALHTLLRLTQPRSLQLHDAQLRAAGCTVLAAWVHNSTGLERLVCKCLIMRCSIDEDGIAEIALGLGRQHGLTHLHLSSCHFDTRGSADLAEHLSKLTNLQELLLPCCGITALGMDALAQSMRKLVRLTKLVLSRNLLGAAGGKAVARVVRDIVCLEELDISENRGLRGDAWVDAMKACARASQVVNLRYSRAN